MAGAIKHQYYEMTKVEPYGEDWLIQPVDGYGNPEQLDHSNTKARYAWFMTDPRFWEWLWAMENEIRPLMPWFIIMFGITSQHQNTIKIL